MQIESQMIDVKWHNRNKRHLVSKGYEFTKMGNTILINSDDLPPTVIAKAKTINTIKTKCNNCESDFDKDVSQFKEHGKHSCSRSCAAKYRAKNNYSNAKKEKINVVCDQCTEPYSVHESVYKKNKWHFCSRECYSKFRSTKLTGENSPSYKGLKAKCDSCYTEFPVIQSTLDRNKNVFCSPECYATYREMYYSGENHNQFGIKKSFAQIEKMRVATAKRIANGEFPQTNTGIQVLTKQLIDSLNLHFEEEIQFKYYVLDFYDSNNNLAIEVMGDFWHANPTKYNSYESLHKIQKKDIKRDKSKNTYLKKYYGINVLYLWEQDINTKPELCKAIIEEYFKKDGILPEYNSFNYSLINEELTLNSNLIQPFFKRVNTEYQTVV